MEYVYDEVCAIISECESIGELNRIGYYLKENRSAYKLMEMISLSGVLQEVTTKLKIIMSEKIKALVISIIEDNKITVEDETQKLTDLGFDSLDVVETIMEIESKVGINIDEGANGLTSQSTVKDLVEVVIKAHLKDGE